MQKLKHCKLILGAGMPLRFCQLAKHWRRQRTVDSPKCTDRAGGLTKAAEVYNCEETSTIQLASICIMVQIYVIKMFTVTNYAVGSGNSFMQLDSSFIIVLQLWVNKSFLIHTKKRKKRRSFLSVLLDISQNKVWICYFSSLSYKAYLLLCCH